VDKNFICECFQGVMVGSVIVALITLPEIAQQGSKLLGKSAPFFRRCLLA
jgi:hypothetical protein